MTGGGGDAAYRAVFFVALLATALALGAALAHALELPNKIALGRDEYFIVQRIYAGWSNLAYLLVVQFIALLASAAMSRRDAGVLRPVILPCLCLVAAQAVFWIWTYPANAATANWTRIPADWETLRRQWEYSHAAGAAFQVLGMMSLTIAVLRRRRE